MSGNGGTVYDAFPPRSPCDRLTFRTVLNSPVPSVIFEIEHDWRGGPLNLDVALETRRGGLQVVVALYNGRRAGAITSDALLRLMECMEQGNEYVAEVRDVSGARVEIQVVRK